MRTTVQLDAREMSIKAAGIFGTKIPYKSIDYVAPAESKGLAAGMGLRVLQNRTTGYLVGGPSVRITLERTAVLVSSDTRAAGDQLAVVLLLLGCPDSHSRSLVCDKNKNGAPNTKFEAPSLANSLVTGRL